jgi:hypothetical protein
LVDHATDGAGACVDAGFNATADGRVTAAAATAAAAAAVAITATPCIALTWSAFGADLGAAPRLGHHSVFGLM